MSKEKNKVQYVLFDPTAVGWDKGLDGAIRDAKQFDVPLAVKSIAHVAEINLRRNDIEVILI